MKKPIILAIIAIFFILVFVYATTTLSPWDKGKFNEFTNQYGIKNQTDLLENFNSIVDTGLTLKLISTRNVLIWLVLLAQAIIFGFAAIHTLIDKLFFKKFFEQPSLVIAFRRGFFLYLIFLGILFLRLIGGLYWYNGLAIAALFIGLELAITNLQRHKTKIVSKKVK